MTIVPTRAALGAPVCDRCGLPVVPTDEGRWVHAEVADAVFCQVFGR